MKVHPITNFFFPERMRKGDKLKLNEDDYLLIVDTVTVSNALQQWDSFCKPKCELCAIIDEDGKRRQQDHIRRFEKRQQGFRCPGNQGNLRHHSREGKHR